MRSRSRRTPRGTTAERGYGSEHEALRAAWHPLVAAGEAWCHAARCIEPRGRWIRPGTPWDLGHTADRSGWTGPEHARCNRADGGRRSHTRRNRKPAPATPVTPLWPTSRSW